MYNTIHSPKLPYQQRVPKLQPGSLIILVGKVQPEAAQFDISLKAKGKIPEIDPDIALHMSCRLSTKSIVLNTMKGGNWQTEQSVPISHSFPFKPAETFEIMILSQRDHFKIAINDKHFTVFPYRLPPGFIEYLSVLGDVHLGKVHFSKQYPADDNIPKAAVPPIPSSTELDKPQGLKGAESNAKGYYRLDSRPLTQPEYNRIYQFVGPTVPFCCKIPGEGLRPGLEVTIKGRPHLHADRFGIDFQQGSSAHPTVIALHFNPRFEKQFRSIVRNTLLNGNWGVEENLNGIPLERGNDFEIRFLIREHCYDIYINNNFFAEYHHRITSLSKIDHLRIYGPLEVKSVDFAAFAFA